MSGWVGTVLGEMPTSLRASAFHTPRFLVTVARRRFWSAIAAVLYVVSFITPSWHPATIHFKTSS